MNGHLTYFIVDEDIAAENDMRGDGAMYYCDKKGKLYKVDLVVTGDEKMRHCLEQGGEVIGSFPNTNGLIYFGMDAYESSARNGDMDDVAYQLREKRFSGAECAAVASAYRRVANKSLLLEREPVAEHPAARKPMMPKRGPYTACHNA